MVDPVAKAVSGNAVGISGEQSGTANVQKTSESKFDRVRAGVGDRAAQQVQIPPEVKQVSPQQQEALKADLSSQVAKGAEPKQVLGVNLQRTKQGVDALAKRVNALPKTPAFQPFRDRLTSIDSQFQAAGKLVQSIKGGESPQQLLKVQMSMYQLGENMELMSKVVEQVTSGMKSILQTQV
jgi:hypothetical protein